MFCNKCGTELPDDSRFCYKCGSAVTPLAYNDTVNDSYIAPESDPFTIATDAELPQQQSPADEGTYGLLGFIFAFFVPLVGLILSIIGVNKKKYSGLAAAGIIISLIFIIFGVISIVLIATKGSGLPSRYF